MGAEVAIFSTNLATHPATHPEKYERAVKTAYFKNKNCKAMLVGPRKVFGPESDPKNSPKWPKKVQKDPKLGRRKKKDRAVIPKPKLIVYIDRFEKSFRDPNPSQK